MSHHQKLTTGTTRIAQQVQIVGVNSTATKQITPTPTSQVLVLPLEVVYKIRPVFEELTKEDELQKCLHGKTQNANESYNGKIWDRIPKTKYVSLTVLKFGVYDAVANFNIGMKSSILIYEKIEHDSRELHSKGFERHKQYAHFMVDLSSKPA